VYAFKRAYNYDVILDYKLVIMAVNLCGKPLTIYNINLNVGELCKYPNFPESVILQ
jgi:hypothetical protein